MKYTFKNEKFLENVVYLANGEYNDLSPFKINTLEMDKQVLKDKYLKSKDLVASLDNLKFPESLIDINFISSPSAITIFLSITIINLSALISIFSELKTTSFSAYILFAW